MNSLSWDDLRYFLEVAEHGSLSAAAKRLGSNQPTVGRHISALEDALSVRLFHRTHTGLTLTQEGTLLLEQAQRVRSRIEDITRRLGGPHEQPQGSVRVALPEGLCNEILIPALPDFYRQYPRIRLLLNVSSRTANLTRGEADVAIRLFRPEEPSLVVRRVGTMEMAIAASHDYLHNHGMPQTEADLATHFAIAYGEELTGLGENQWLTRHVPPDGLLLKSDSTTARRLATENGLGISIQPRMSVERSNNLVTILEQVPIPSHPIWLVYHQDLKDIFRVRVVLDFLSALFEHANDASNVENTYKNCLRR